MHEACKAYQTLPLVMLAQCRFAALQDGWNSGQDSLWMTAFAVHVKVYQSI